MLAKIFDFPFIPQSDAVDCGPACLKMVSIYFGIPDAESRISHLLRKSSDGVSLKEISDVSFKIGLKNMIVRIDHKILLNRVELPALLHWNGNHFVVLIKTTPNFIYIADPMKGILKLRREELKSKWYLNIFDNMGMAILFEKAC